jgi:hypothetical protein
VARGQRRRSVRGVRGYRGAARSALLEQRGACIATFAVFVAFALQMRLLPLVGSPRVSSSGNGSRQIPAPKVREKREAPRSSGEWTAGRRLSLIDDKSPRNANTRCDRGGQVSRPPDTLAALGHENAPELRPAIDAAEAFRLRVFLRPYVTLLREAPQVRCYEWGSAALERR